SGDGWRQVAHTIELPPVREARSPAPSPVAEGPSIETAAPDPWEDYRNLAASSVPPGLAVPVPWRRYQQILRRYDQLRRAVGPGAARRGGAGGGGGPGGGLAALRSQRRDLNMGRSRRLTGSGSATLVMPLVEGHTGPDGAPIDPAAPGQDLKTWFDEWWLASE